MYFNPYKNEYFDVENLALRYYSLHENLNGMHCENAFGKYLFGILFWDIVFESEIPYVWQTPFQAVPLDFGTKDFYLQRKELIETRLDEIAGWTGEKVQAEVLTRYESARGKHNVLVSWDSVRLN